MRVLTAAHHHMTYRLWQQYPNHIGCIVSPARPGRFKHPLPYSCDNYAFPLWRQGKQFDEEALAIFIAMLDFYASYDYPPDWVAVPDVVCNPEATSKQWKEYSSIVQDYGFKTAFVIQNGHTPSNVPSDADYVFVGGSTDWKYWAVKEFSPRFPTHVGRVNGNNLWLCYCAGALSCDGSGWFRGDHKQLAKLLEYLRCVNVEVEPPVIAQFDNPPSVQLSLFTDIVLVLATPIKFETQEPS